MKSMKVASLVAASFLAALAGPAAAQRRAGERAEARPADRRPAVRVEVATVVPSEAGMIVLLKTVEGEKYLPIWVGPSEALAIQLRMAHEEFARPLTHDLLDSILRRLDARVVRVTVVDLRDGTFIGQVDLRSGRREHHIDARSSDSIAIALGNGAPIFVAAHVLDQAGLDRATLERDGYQGEPVELDRRHTL